MKFISSKSLIKLVLVLSLFLLIPFLASRLPSFFALAGTFTTAKLTISDSRATADSVSYAFSFAPTGTGQIKRLEIKFCTESSSTGSCSAPSGLNTSSVALSAGHGIDGSLGATSSPANNIIRTEVTTPADQITSPITPTYTGITNPSNPNQTYYARITTYSDTGTTIIDSAVIAFAILSSNAMALTASVDSSLSVTITAATSGNVNQQAINVTDSTAPNVIPFGTLSDNSSKVAAHDINVTTSAPNGYLVTVKSTNPPLIDGTNNIDNFTATGGSPTTWSSPGGSVVNVNTAFFGYTTENDTPLQGTQNRFISSGGNKWAGFSTSPEEIIGRTNAPAGGSEQVRVGWRAEVNELQPPGSYSGSVIMVVTPTF